MRAFDTLDFLMGAVEAETIQRLRPPPSDAVLPVVLVTGFLGAGKTTLMRRLVSTNHGLKLAAVVNDMANLNLDAALVAQAGADLGVQTLALANGCVCCSRSGAVARTLTDIQAWAALPDYVVLEASGVADPATLAGVAHGMSGVRLEAVVAVVDADRLDLKANSDATRLVARGIGAADLILLNKTDLVTRSRAAALEQVLLDLAPKAAILRTSHCAVPMSLIFAGESRDDAQLLDADVEDDRFATLELRQRRALPRQQVAALIASAPAEVYRAKGVLRLTDTEVPELLQAVGRRWAWTAADTGGEFVGRLVVISSADAGAVASHFAPSFFAS